MEFVRKRSCFVIAPLGVGVAQFLEALRVEGFEPFFISDFLASGERLTSRVRTAFRSVDLVIALLFSERSLENVYFELGIALGLAKPTIVFADRGIKRPDFLKRIAFHHASLDNLPSLIPIIDRWLSPKRQAESAARLDYAHGYRTRQERKLAPPRDKLLAAIRDLKGDQYNLSKPDAAERLEAGLIGLFTAAGLPVAKAPAQVRRRVRVPDLALWIDDVQKEIGNPIAVEIKSQLLSQEVDDAVSQLTASLTSVGATAGILLHTNRDLRTPDYVYQASPLIFIFSVQDLLEFLENDSFSSILKRSRNVATHRIA